MTVEQINKSLINVAAKVQLERAHQYTDETSPYLLQLARWGRDDFLAGQSENLKHELSELLDNMPLAEPEQVVQMFYPHREEAEDAAEEMMSTSPMQAANLVLEDLVREAIDVTYERIVPPHAGAYQATYFPLF